MKVLCIDNFDSFIYNLVYEFEALNCEVTVIRNDADLLNIGELVQKNDAILLSPGPGTPKQAGNLIPVIKKYAKQKPILGICLGHQAIVEAYGGRVISAPEVIHGKTSSIQFSNSPLFSKMVSPQKMARYHSLLGADIPECLSVDAVTEKNEIMAVSHKVYPCFGVQFHPESIMSLKGNQVIENFIHFTEKFIAANNKEDGYVA